MGFWNYLFATFVHDAVSTQKTSNSVPRYRWSTPEARKHIVELRNWLKTGNFEYEPEFDDHSLLLDKINYSLNDEIQPNPQDKSRFDAYFSNAFSSPSDLHAQFNFIDYVLGNCGYEFWDTRFGIDYNTISDIVHHALQLSFQNIIQNSNATSAQKSVAYFLAGVQYLQCGKLDTSIKCFYSSLNYDRLLGAPWCKPGYEDMWDCALVSIITDINLIYNICGLHKCSESLVVRFPNVTQSSISVIKQHLGTQQWLRDLQKSEIRQLNIPTSIIGYYSYTGSPYPFNDGLYRTLSHEERMLYSPIYSYSPVEYRSLESSFECSGSGIKFTISKNLLASQTETVSSVISV